MMSDLQRQFEAVIQRLTYKPTWKISVGRFPEQEWDNRMKLSTFNLILSCRVPSIDPPHVIIELTHMTTISDWDNEVWPTERIVNAISREIRRFEEHEAREWFKLDGFCVDDPHPERNPFAGMLYVQSDGKGAGYEGIERAQR